MSCSENPFSRMGDGSLVVGEPGREGGAVGERTPRVRVREQDLVPVSAQVELTTTSSSSIPTTYAHGLTR